MSDRPCNFCQYQKLQEKAAMEHCKLSKKKNPFGNFKKGVDIFITDEEGKKEWLLWFAELGDECAC